MLRHAFTPPKLFPEVALAVMNGRSPLIFLRHVRNNHRCHKIGTFSKLRIMPPRSLLVNTKLITSMSSSAHFRDLAKARKLKFDSPALHHKGLLGFQKSYTPLANATENAPTSRKTPANSNVLNKKRTKRKGTTNATVMDEYGYNFDEEENFPITAYAVCEEFDLKGMHKGLLAQGLYIPTILSDDLTDVIHVSAKYPIGDEPREIFFFREGAVVFWNISYLEIVNVLKFLKEYQEESYDKAAIEEECEYMSYAHSDQGHTRLVRGIVYLGDDPTNKVFEKYAFANALASSVKLGMWESTLEKYVETIEHITEALKRAEDLKLTRAEVMQKTGELFALRHQLNLNSDLLDTPDFYWERERLETLYQKTCDYLSVSRRTKVMNEKLSQCCELLDLISSHLTDQHHTRLEWMIIVLIMIEVGFEILHLLERYEIIHS